MVVRHLALYCRVQFPVILETCGEKFDYSIRQELCNDLDALGIPLPEAELPCGFK